MIEALAGDRNSGINPIETCAKPKPAMPWTIDATSITTEVRPVVTQFVVIVTDPDGDGSRASDVGDDHGLRYPGCRGVRDNRRDWTIIGRDRRRDWTVRWCDATIQDHPNL
ncbi:hypothetical protein C479_13933 [Halovivax asiaticus JCM 14624]|uniref:Uncharacterized protein n=1 Tax=Halovivax asiaticus JCM 14624 TaxID=1227490 RepID=M0BFL8_9EURY|nr:hypothetical protein C479_13933 [Halovivax asiaticus JCM 14624]